MWTQDDAGDLVIALCYAIDAGAKPEDILATIQGVFDDKAESFAQAGKWDACKPFADMSSDLAEVQRLRLENDRLRAEKARTCGECRHWRFKSDSDRAFGVCDSPQVADYTKMLVHGRPDLREEIKDYGRLETDERFCCMFWEAIGSERKE